MRNLLHGAVQLFAAITPQRTQHVAGEALRVDAHQDILLIFHVAHDEGHVLFLVIAACEQHELKLAMTD